MLGSETPSPHHRVESIASLDECKELQNTRGFGGSRLVEIWVQHCDGGQRHTKAHCTFLWGIHVYFADTGMVVLISALSQQLSVRDDLLHSPVLALHERLWLDPYIPCQLQGYLPTYLAAPF